MKAAAKAFLTKCEIAIYFAVYIVYIVIGLCKIYALRDRILDAAQFQFADGWSLFHWRRRDDSNDELENFNSYIATYVRYYLLHALVSGLLRGKSSKLQYYGYASVCALALCVNLHTTSLIMFVALFATYFVVAEMHSKLLVWLLSGIWIVVINIAKSNEPWLATVGYTEYVLVIVALSWSLLRGCSYALTYIGDKLYQSELSFTDKVAQYLGYAMYFPCLTYGPFISYPRFLGQRQTEGWLSWLSFVISLARVAFWWLFMQCALHFFYIHYMTRDVTAVAMMESVFWQHAAGYFIGQFFFLYYIVTYGLGIAFAVQDGIPAPARPRCIGRIHFYSDMWRYFDEGLYEFLFRHIYTELCGKQSSVAAKFGATALTFSFVFVWHGCYNYVLIWSVLNFLCLAAEKCYMTLVTWPSYQSWMQKYLGVGGSNRLHALLATQLFIPAAFSNVYFIGGKEVGDFLMRGAYMSGWGNYLALCFCSYCFFQCSELLRTDTQKKTKTN